VSHVALLYFFRHFWQIKIHTEPTEPGEYGHFNMEQTTWETGALLEVFYISLFI